MVSDLKFITCLTWFDSKLNVLCSESLFFPMTAEHSTRYRISLKDPGVLIPLISEQIFGKNPLLGREYLLCTASIFDQEKSGT